MADKTRKPRKCQGRVDSFQYRCRLPGTYLANVLIPLYESPTIQPEHPFADARVLEPGCPRGERYEWGTGSG